MYLRQAGSQVPPAPYMLWVGQRQGCRPPARGAAAPCKFCLLWLFCLGYAWSRNNRTALSVRMRLRSTGLSFSASTSAVGSSISMKA